MKTFFTSDTHIGHSNIIKYCKRPFSHCEEMDETIIDNWNKTVHKDDVVYHLGDVAFVRDEYKLLSILNRLNGTIHLVLGNHDKCIQGSVVGRFASVSNFKEIYVQDSSNIKGRQHIVLCHYALRVWNKSHHGSWHLYGHSHGSLPPLAGSLSLDVGSDCWNYTPVEYNFIKQKLSTIKFKPIDQHGED